MKKVHQTGFTPVVILLVLILVAVVGFAGYYVYNTQQNKKDAKQTATKLASANPAATPAAPSLKGANYTYDGNSGMLVVDGSLTTIAASLRSKISCDEDTKTPYICAATMGSDATFTFNTSAAASEGFGGACYDPESGPNDESLGTCPKSISASSSKITAVGDVKVEKSPVYIQECIWLNSNDKNYYLDTGLTSEVYAKAAQTYLGKYSLLPCLNRVYHSPVLGMESSTNGVYLFSIKKKSTNLQDLQNYTKTSEYQAAKSSLESTKFN
jgi:uncharacterized protein (UPF0333 family)